MVKTTEAKQVCRAASTVIQEIHFPAYDAGDLQQILT